jgi:glutamate carboxypeptidase
MISDLGEIVNCDSPSADLDSLWRCARLLADVAERVCGVAPEIVTADARPHLLMSFPGRPRILLLGHFDTVWPAGTALQRPFELRAGRATGPGVFDMKAGVIQGLFAVATAVQKRGIRVLLTSDEETGSDSSRDLIALLARQVRAVLVLEPSSEGRLKTARKGFSVYHMTLSGRAAHPGLDPEHGASALSEAAHRILALESLSRAEAGTTVIATMARAGIAANVVPAAAEITIDVRAASMSEQKRIDKAVRASASTVPGVVADIRGGINRPPFRPAASRRLFEVAAAASERLGLGTLLSATVGGASDGNLTAALGTPTLDGLGAVGGGAHREDEWVDVSKMPERCALVAELIDHLDG